MEPPRKYPLVPDDPQQLARDDTFAATTFDEEGIIIVHYRFKDIGPQYNPVIVALHALSNYNAYREKSHEQNLDSFSKHARWLMDTFADKGKWGVWYYQFDFVSPGARCLKPWTSSMIQGLGMSTLIRYHSFTRDPRALEIARKALAAYDVPVDEGGILRIDKRGSEWYEEYPCPGSGTALNGFITSLIGAKELSDYAGDPEGLEKFNSGLKTLRLGLREFELRLPFRRWTRYDNLFIIHSGRKYHDLHVRQMKVLLELCEEEGNDFLREYYDRWSRWQRTYGKSRLYLPYQVLCRGYAIVVSRLFGWWVLS